jgi:peptidoglycan/LPS O-acetylase OafA/YrhL
MKRSPIEFGGTHRLCAARGGSRLSRFQEFRADIQGLRAVAIVPVVLYHAHEPLVPGGFVGVDVFFVISGFLITRILVREIDAGSFSLAAFYARRVRRLFPALFAMLAATLGAGLMLMPSPALAELGEAVAWTAFFAANFHQYWNSDYFARLAELKPLLHTWSLGVEEQFYIAFPLFLAVVTRYLRGWLTPAICAGAAVSLAWSWYLTRVSPSSEAFYLPHSRAYEIAIGALLALGAVPRIRTARILDALSLAGLAMIVAACGLVDANTPYPGLAGLLPCFGTALVIYAGSGRDTPAERLLALPVMQFVGAISYSLYLWHWPVLVFARYVVLGELGATATALSLALAFALAVLSYRLLEQPARSWRAKPSRMLAGGAAVAAATALGGIALISLEGLPQRFDRRSQAIFAAAEDANPRRDECHWDNGPSDYSRSCVFGARGAVANVAVWSDSFGAELAVALGERLAKDGGAARQLSASACPPSVGYSPAEDRPCADHNRVVLDGLLDDAAVETVVLFAYYEAYAAERARMFRAMREAAERLHAAGKRIVLVYPLPKPDFDVPEALGMIAWHGGDLAAWGPGPASGDPDHVTEKFLDSLGKEVGAARIKPVSAFCSQGHCRTVGPGDAVFYFDDRHLSLTGARWLVARQPLPDRRVDE